MPDTEGPEKRGPADKEPGKREFMREKIVRQRLSMAQIVKRTAVFFCLSVVFGVIAAISFVLAKPLADRYLGEPETEESVSVSFTKDEPETWVMETTVPETRPKSEEEFKEEIEDILSGYQFSVENLKSIYETAREISLQADKGVVTVCSGKQQVDLFGNPVESTGNFAGVVIAKTGPEYIIFTYADAVRQADSINVTFFDGTRAPGEVKQVDGLMDMAVVSVKAGAVERETAKELVVLTLGNSYSVKSGDFVIGMGGPAGAVHSTTYGAISYVSRNVILTDGITRILYADLRSDSQTGTFLINPAGEIIGWAADKTGAGESANMTVAVSISDYKASLEKMTNGFQIPYFGVKGQEVNETMIEAGIPLGVYVLEAVAESPAYDAGIQNGDIITHFGKKEITTFKELQTQIENAAVGASIPVEVMRKGRDGYQELEYAVTIRAR